MDPIDWWNDEEREASEVEAICDHLGWPRQYAEGEASLEWLTPEQYEDLEAVPSAVLQAAEEWAGREAG